MKNKYFDDAEKIRGYEDMEVGGWVVVRTL